MPKMKSSQCRKCRTPVNTIAMPASSAALITSSSRIDPPRWITAVAPASIATSRPSANGKNASDATTEPLVIRCTSFASSAACCSLRAAIPAFGEDSNGLVGGVGRNDDFGQDFSDDGRGFGIERAIDGDDAAVRRLGVAGERLAIGGDEIGAFGDAARVGMLDDDASGGANWIELGDAFIGGVRVVDVVVRQLLAL